MKSIFISFILLLFTLLAQAQFPYRIVLDEIEIEGLPGMHSFAYAQHEGKWIIIGGRLDGLHARQPFAAFPASSNNTSIFLIDVANRTFKTKSLGSLPQALQEQLQATNMNFTQSGKHLILIGGYAFAASLGNHITFPNLAVVDIPGLIAAIETDAPILPYFRQIRDEKFAVNGGQLGQIEDKHLLVGGHRFNGRYNPMGGNSFSQTYTEAIISFKLDLKGTELRYHDYEVTKDAVHLHRRDYNLVPFMFDRSTPGYLLSSGVFQKQADLPFLYPVEILSDSYTPREDFNQYLSNYHGPKVGLYQEAENQMHALFFGGISQYYYQGNEMVKDDAVPFVKTISRVTRNSDGAYTEYRMDTEMPALNTASAEFIINPRLPQTPHKVLLLDQVAEETIILGHILGGIESPSLNPFAMNQTQTTSASAKIYTVKLVKDTPTRVEPLDGRNPYTLTLYPNPAKDLMTLQFNLELPVPVYFMISNMEGKIVQQGPLRNIAKGLNNLDIPITSLKGGQAYVITLVFNNRFSVSKRFSKGY